MINKSPRLEPETRDEMLEWRHGGGFSLDAAVRLVQESGAEAVKIEGAGARLESIRRIVEAAHQTAKDLLNEKRTELDKISKILLEREMIDAEQFVALGRFQGVEHGVLPFLTNTRESRLKDTLQQLLSRKRIILPDLEPSAAEWSTGPIDMGR